MKTSDFAFELPEQLIAKYPTEQRTASRLLHLDGLDAVYFYTISQAIHAYGFSYVMNGGARMLTKNRIWQEISGLGTIPLCFYLFTHVDNK